MYDSPIKMFVEDMIGKLDESVWKAVINVGFDIDKEELRKALEYDRDQYRKGYEDGKLAAVVHAHWIIGKDPVFGEVVRYECSHCCEHWSPIDGWLKFCRCPNCGAMMDEKVTSEEEDG